MTRDQATDAAPREAVRIEPIANGRRGSAVPTLFSKETLEDLFHGQHVIVMARWILVVGGLILALWNPAAIDELRVQIVFLLALAVGNFFIHAQLLKRRPLPGELVMLASAVDILAISVMIGIAAPRVDSDVFNFYFPAVLAFAVTFPPLVTGVLTAGVLAIYSSLAFSSFFIEGAETAVVTRLIMIAAVAVVGAIYWQIERNRRRQAADAQRELMAQIHERDADYAVAIDAVESRERS